jgi:hypothetical protein
LSFTKQSKASPNKARLHQTKQGPNCGKSKNKNCGKSKTPDPFLYTRFIMKTNSLVVAYE